MGGQMWRSVSRCREGKAGGKEEKKIWKGVDRYRGVDVARSRQM